MTQQDQRAAFEVWWAASDHFLSELDFCLMPDGRYEDDDVDVAWEAYQAARAALQSQDREDALIETVLDACDEWSGYVEVDNAPRTLREHVKMAIDHARRIEGEGK